MSGLRVLRPGFFDTIQDRGRFGHRAFGVPLGGAFDAGAAALANALLANPSDAAVVEMTLLGGTYEAQGSLAVALAGAMVTARVEPAAGTSRSMESPVAFSLKAGDRLIVGEISGGARVYLATRKGWQTPVVLQSRSTENPLRAGEELPCAEGVTPTRRLALARTAPMQLDPSPLRFLDGPDAAVEISEFLESAEGFRVEAQSNRMGLRLEPLAGAGVFATDPERVSMPVAPGAVQLAGGKPLLLGVACGTMGGYPHVGHVISADLDRIAQLRPGDVFRLQRIGLDEARQLDTEARDARRRWLRQIHCLATD